MPGDNLTGAAALPALSPEAGAPTTERAETPAVQFQDRLVSKVYVAVVAGVVPEVDGVVDLPMRKDLDDTPRQIIDHVRGRPSVTNWRVLARDADRTRLEVTPVTGRSHQIRLHLKTIGHPILGDDLYAPPEIRAAADRLLLHALSLSIAHPGNAAPMTFEAACPF